MHNGAIELQVMQEAPMSLSYLEPELLNDTAAPRGRLARLRLAAANGSADLVAGLHEVTSSPLFASVLLRVTSCLALAFVLVRVVRFYTA